MVTDTQITRSPELVAAYNASVRDGTQTEDPRQDFNHPLHDIVCGWCGEVHTDAAPASRQGVSLVSPEISAPCGCMDPAAYQGCDCGNPGDTAHEAVFWADIASGRTIAALHEELASAYIELSGKRTHMSDCATSCAPAYKPSHCDCGL